MTQSTLHPGARWLFRFKAYVTTFTMLIFLMLFSRQVFIFTILNTVVIIIISTIIMGEVYSRMAYNRFLYEFTPTNLRVERGIIWKRYSNIPYKRVQNVDIQRGIIARLFGFSTVSIQTAGYSAYSQSGMQAEGNLPGVSISGGEKIREFIMKKIGKNAKGGL